VIGMQKINDNNKTVETAAKTNNTRWERNEEKNQIRIANFLPFSFLLSMN